MKYVKLDDIKAKVEQAEINAHWDNEVFNAEYVNDVLDFVPWVDNIQPAIKAKWVEIDEHKHKCSHCNFTINPWTASFYNYCPNCGASMR